jgi:hypothetical protein
MKLDQRTKLVLHDADKLTDFDRKDISIWLKNLSKAVMVKGNKFSKRFTARFMK